MQFSEEKNVEGSRGYSSDHYPILCLYFVMFENREENLG